MEQLLQQQAEQEHGRRAKPRPPEWIVELGIGVGRPPTQVHRGTCYMAGKRRRPVGRDEARHLLADGTSACTHCRPDIDLGINIGLPDPCLLHAFEAASPAQVLQRSNRAPSVADDTIDRCCFGQTCAVDHQGEMSCPAVFNRCSRATRAV
ncbi:DUF6233 domain-containing protein [Streptomyces sp. NPDC001709]